MTAKGPSHRQHGIYLSKIQPLMHRPSLVMKAIGLCEWRLLLQSFILQPAVEYTPLATPPECFITEARSQGLLQPPHHT